MRAITSFRYRLARGGRLLAWSLRHPTLAARGATASTFSLDELGAAIGEPRVILEAGVADGSDTLDFLLQWPKVTIIGVEPIIHLFDEAVTRTGPYRDRCHLFRSALGPPMCKSVDLFTGPDHHSSSVLEPTLHRDIFPSIEFSGSQSVPSMSLDALAAMAPAPPDLLWLDLQGFELEELKSGGLKTLQSSRFLHIEVSRLSMYRSAPIYSDVIAFLETRGFDLVDLRMPANFGNALFINRHPSAEAVIAKQ